MCSQWAVCRSMGLGLTNSCRVIGHGVNRCRGG
jgi:hypothetical protein